MKQTKKTEPMTREDLEYAVASCLGAAADGWEIEYSTVDLLTTIDLWVSEVIGEDEEIHNHEFGVIAQTRNVLRSAQRQRAFGDENYEK